MIPLVDNESYRLTIIFRSFFDTFDYLNYKGLFFMLVSGVIYSVIVFIYLLRFTHMSPLQFIFII